jgi:hypothetical protein
MPEVISLAVSQLDLDTKNPRLGREYSSQMETARALAAQQGSKLIGLASHIIEHGIDPTTLSAVIQLPGRRPRYRVLEGNRRLLALRALESPSLITTALESRETRALAVLGAEFATRPIDRINCVRFDTEDEAKVWVELRHTTSEGAGLVPWTAEEKRRYEARFGPGSIELQILDFVKASGGIDKDATGSFITNINRALLSKKLMANFGLEKDKEGRVLSWFPADEIKKSLTKLVNDMYAGRQNSRSLNSPEHREDYFKSFTAAELPDPSLRLTTPAPLDNLPPSAGTGAKGSGKKTPAKPAPKPRSTVIPKGSALNPSSSRLKEIMRELSSLNLNDFSNAASVLLRVFVELAVDDAIQARPTLSNLASETLAKKLKGIAEELHANNQIHLNLKRVIVNVANSQTNLLAAGVFGWHQYVHNQYVHPKATELRQTWDELEPFLRALWP